MSEWVELELVDCTINGNISYGIVQPGQDDPNGVPIIRVNNFENGTLNTDSILKVKSNIETKHSKTRLEGGEVLLTLVGSTGQTAIVPEKLKGWNVARAVAVIRVKPEIGAKWINLWLRSSKASQHLNSRANTTVQKTLNLKDVKSIPVSIPPEFERKSIEYMVFSIEDKIELNRQMNQTLEAMAQALFKSWFVDFDPVLDNALTAGNKIPEELQARAEKRKGLSDSKKLLSTNPILAAQFPYSFIFNETLGKWIPEGWEVKSLGSSAETVLGGTPSTKNESYWTNGTIGWLNSGKVNEFRILQPTQFITEDALNNSATKLMPVGTTLLAITGATLGQISRIEKQFCANQSVVGIIGNKYLSNEFIYLWIHQNIHFLTQNATGGAQQHVNKNNVNELQILLPPQQLRDSLNQEVFSMFTKIAINCSEIEILTELRDRLLPELISGRVRVAEGMLNPKNKQ